MTLRTVKGTRVTLAHGGGGKAMKDLIDDVFVRELGGEVVLEDQARLPMAELAGDRLARFLRRHATRVSRRRHRRARGVRHGQRSRGRAQRDRRGLEGRDRVDEAKTPVREEVRGFCEILGLDPCYLANEASSSRSLAVGADSVAIGKVIAGTVGRVTMQPVLGGHRIVDICWSASSSRTSRDADRIRATGAPAVQLNTGTGCHLEADMIARGLAELAPADGGVVMIENVGNLVCPAMFDLGERAKVAILSVTESDDKPLEYPHMFRASALMVLNKIDLLPHVDFDMQAAIANARQVNPAIDVVAGSARSGEGLGDWYGWIASRS